jgi:hypothetical protein
MATVKLDTIDACSGRLTVAGWEWERGAIITGLTPTNPYGLGQAAFAATGLAIGDAWPGGGGAVLEEAVPIAISPDQVRLRLVYRQPISNYDLNVWKVSVTGSLAMVQTNKDAAGNAVTVSYTWPTSESDPNYPTENSELAGKTRTVGDLRSVLRPELSIVASRRTVVYDPIVETLALQGHVNSSLWHGGAAGGWLCELCSFVSEVYGGNIWIQTVQLHARPWSTTGWKSRVMFVDRNTGYPPSDLVENTGMKDVTDYPSADFSVLLPLL